MTRISNKKKDESVENINNFRETDYKINTTNHILINENINDNIIRNFEKNLELYIISI